MINYFILTCWVVVLFLIVWMLRAFLKQRNFASFWLGVPYLILSFVPVAWATKDALNRPKQVSIFPMVPVGSLSSKEMAVFAFNSKATLGDGMRLAGGLIPSKGNRNIEKILKSKGVDPLDNMTLIWIVDYSATKVYLQGDLCFVPHMKRAEGVWIGWIEDKNINNVKRMDGVDE